MKDYSILTNLSIFGETLSEICVKSSKICYLQDITSLKLHSVSVPFSQVLGLTQRKMIGNTLRILSLNTPSLHSALNEQHIQQSEAINQQIKIQEKTIITERATFTDNFGFIRIERVIKTPIIHSKKVIAIVNYADDLTKYYDALSLFNLYRSHYPEKKAVLQFLKYFSLDQFFQTLPTCNELLALLALFFNKTGHNNTCLLKKYLSQSFDYINQLSNKLIKISIEEILFFLTYQETPTDNIPL